jgi:antitoxin (DNA-binding transcriptional repressor) of toxin-antitoxin stability system
VEDAMVKVAFDEAQARLRQLIEEALGGEEVFVALEDGSSVQIVGREAAPARPRFGSSRGKFVMADDFDAPLEDFRPYEQ